MTDTGIENLTKKVQEHNKKIERMTFTVNEAAQVLGIGQNKMRQLTKSKGFPVLKVGTRVLIPIKAFEKWVDDSVGLEF